MSKLLVPHPVALLFPELTQADYEALKEDIRLHGVKVPILVHGDRFSMVAIVTGRAELGIRCLVVEWNGHDPWLEVQSRNLMRRHLAKDQVYAIRKLAARQFPELAVPLQAERDKAQARKAQARGRPRGQKALLRSQDRHSESADVIGALIGVSGTTVKRVERLAREAPELLPRVAAGQLSVKRALRGLEKKSASGESSGSAKRVAAAAFSVDASIRQMEQMIRAAWKKWPREHRAEFLRALQVQIRKLASEHTTTAQQTVQFSEPPEPLTGALPPRKRFDLAG